MFHQTSNPSRFLTNLASILVKKDTKETILEPRNKNSFSWLATTTSTTAITSTSSQTNNPTSSSPITQSTSQRNISDTHFSIGTPSNDNEDGDDDDGVLISTSALIAIISSLSILLLLIILFLAMSICLRYYRKKEEARYPQTPHIHKLFLNTCKKFQVTQWKSPTSTYAIYVTFNHYSHGPTKSIL